MLFVVYGLSDMLVNLQMIMVHFLEFPPATLQYNIWASTLSMMWKWLLCEYVVFCEIKIVVKMTCNSCRARLTEKSRISMRVYLVCIRAICRWCRPFGHVGNLWCAVERFPAECDGVRIAITKSKYFSLTFIASLRWAEISVRHQQDISKPKFYGHII